MISNSLKVYVLGMVAGLLAAIIPGFLGTTISLVSNLMLLYALYQIRAEHQRLQTAFTMEVGVIIAGVISVVLAGIAAATAFGNALGFTALLSVLVMIITVVTLVIGLLAKYYFYWGLDDLNNERGYQYPTGQIKWCFYISLIGGLLQTVLFFSAGLQTVVMLLTLGTQIYLMYKYWKVVEAQELQ